MPGEFRDLEDDAGLPRRTIEIKEKVEYLSILDPEGVVDEKLDPALGADLALYIYRLMMRSRRFDERMVNLQRQGRIGTYGPSHGHEACFCGASVVMEPEDWIVHAYREIGSFFHRGWPMERILQFWGGYEEGCCPPEGVNDTPIAVPIATQCLHAVGVAWGMKIKGRNDAVLTYCGDGGTSEGDFHEAMNYAGVNRLPVVFFIVNNQWAISVPREKQTASETIAQKAVAYGFDGIQVDGNDVLACYAATKEAVDKAKAGKGPTLVEGVTYRLGVHTTADDPSKYRSKEEVAKWERLEPIHRYQTYLKSRGILDDKLIQEIESDVVSEVGAAVERYEAGKDVDPLDCFDYTFEGLPAELVQQREELAKALTDEGRAEKG